LFAVRARIARVAKLCLGVGQALALEVGRGQIVKQDVSLSEKVLFPSAQRRFNLRSLGIKLIHVAVKPVFIEGRIGTELLSGRVIFRDCLESISIATRQTWAELS
jgi:hypothetical protein